MNISITKILGDTLTLREWKPENPNSEAVILLHGIESHSEWFIQIANNLSENGYAVLAYDRAGWGMSKGRRGHIQSYQHILKQLITIASSLRKSHSRVHLVGLSWGGMFALYASMRRRIFFDSLSMIAPGIFPNTSFSTSTKIKITTAILSKNLRKNFDLPIRIDDFTKDYEKREYINNDSLRNHTITANTAFETLKMQQFCKEMTPLRKLLPATLLLGENDNIIKNKPTKNLFAKQNISIQEYPQKLHSLIFEAPEKSTQDLIDNFKKSQVNSRTKPKILIMGAGAVGSLVGGYLALGGNDVTLVGRKKHVEAINNNGLCIKLGGVERNSIKENIRAVQDITELSEDFDIIIISVKSFDTPTVLEQLKDIITDKTTLLSLQNGISNEEIIHSAYPTNTLLAGIICMTLDFVSSGYIECSDDKGGIAIGLYSGNAAEAVNAITALRASGLQVDYYEEASDRIKWSKMLLNISSNVLNAITGLSYKEILTDKLYGTLAVNAIKETLTVMKKENIEPIKLPGYNMEALAKLCKAPNFIIRKVMARMADGNKNTVTSMKKDLTKLKSANASGTAHSTELSELNGKIVELGKKHHIPTPANRQLCKMLEAHC